MNTTLSSLHVLLNCKHVVCVQVALVKVSSNVTIVLHSYFCYSLEQFSLLFVTKARRCLIWHSRTRNQTLKVLTLLHKIVYCRLYP